MVNLALIIEQLFQSIKAELKSCLPKEVGTTESVVVDLLGRLSQKISDAIIALENVSKYQGSPADSYWRLSKFRNQVRMSRVGMTMTLSKSIVG